MTEPDKPDPKPDNATRATRARRPSGPSSPRTKTGGKRKKDERGHLFVSKLTHEITETIGKAIEGGALPETAAAAAGVHVSTFRRWLAAGRLWIEEHDDDELPSPEAAFTVRIERALADVRSSLEQRVAGSEDWRASMEVLARRWPREWAKRDRLDIGNPEGEVFSLAGVTNLEAIYTREELVTLRMLLAKAAEAQRGADVIDMPVRRRELGAG